MKLRRLFFTLALMIVGALMLGTGGMETCEVQAAETIIPTPISPAGDIRDRFPTYTWSNVSADYYQVQVKQGGTVVYFETFDSSVCS
jgi:hypothetical protein